MKRYKELNVYTTSMDGEYAYYAVQQPDFFLTKENGKLGLISVYRNIQTVLLDCHYDSIYVEAEHLLRVTKEGKQGIALLTMVGDPLNLRPDSRVYWIIPCEYDAIDINKDYIICKTAGRFRALFGGYMSRLSGYAPLSKWYEAQWRDGISYVGAGYLQCFDEDEHGWETAHLIEATTGREVYKKRGEFVLLHESEYENVFACDELGQLSLLYFRAGQEPQDVPCNSIQFVTTKSISQSLNSISQDKSIFFAKTKDGIDMLGTERVKRLLTPVDHIWAELKIMGMYGREVAFCQRIPLIDYQRNDDEYGYLINKSHDESIDSEDEKTELTNG